MTADEAIGEDIHEIFLQLTGLTRVPRLRKLLHAPFSLHQAIVAKIDREAEHARAGKPARIIAKLNALTEPTIIQALYRASRAGVRDRPHRARRVLPAARRARGLRADQGALHRRAFSRAFARVSISRTAASREVYCASADWMDRNLFRRIEVAFPGGVARVSRPCRRGAEPLSRATMSRPGSSSRAASICAPTGSGNVSAQARAVEPLRRARRAHGVLSSRRPRHARLKTGESRPP